MKKVVITGGTGFIGLWLVREMLVHDIEVIVLVRDLNMTKFESVEKKQTLRLVQYHTEEYEQLKKADTRVDAFYHLAWAGVSSSEKNDGRMQLENVRFSMEMLEYARQIRAKRFMGMGTVAEYAFSENTIEANGNRQTPNDMYGAAKTAAHYMLEAYARILELPFNWVVLPSTFGEGRRDDNIITYTITTLLKGQKPQYGMLTQMWDFLYVKEVVRALRLIGEQGCEGKTYGVGSGVFRQLKDYIIKIRDIIDPNLELGIGEIPLLSDKASSS